ncbi:hypothetical protein ABB37_08081 [Leptomonas pyrrhocoris]|uniref:Amastin-like protein n=1 Tax=Leptomonas pyrrhocoris TaxID=157538 RepID=A0A0M9FTR6_LEPPY|nr:hypothetical protein ABB37_08081 [Leptomonas pyrrhocoris]XP_015654350.1 hypothetical protein ABB37_08081 [Leptomonas pyrrhocoris]KPA75910.1 hypothetical protein ABB37_08081 [Leptomonas pyrrhocoris]KPA75911.1 hypothetical protein ABB37_08081 [Leptomonas pyrrhocoris]|eukprot:XP_015654349.1 hypothetical protein ABB37_08081 [Leptomonas pyrrhocoris]
MSDKKDYPTEDEKAYPTEDKKESPAEEKNEYPTEEQQPQRENHEPHDEDGEEEASVCSSAAQDRKDLEECPGVDLRAVPEEHSGKVVLIFYVIFAFISFVFMLTASCPIPWLNDGKGRKWTVWKDVSGTKWKDYPCDHKRAMFQGMEAFAISGCVLSLICFIVGLLQLLGMGHMGVTLLFSFIDVMVLLTDWSLLVNQYHKYSCPGEEAYVARINRLNAGFALVFCSFGLMFIGTVALMYWMNETFSMSEIHHDKYRSGALLSTLVTGAVLTIATVGTAQTMFEQYYANYTLKVTFWHVEFYQRTTGLSEYWGLDAYHCSKFKNQMHAGAAFSIISDAFLFITLLCSVAAVFNRCCKWLAIGFGIASWVFLLICWAIVVGARYKTFCSSGVAPPLVGVPLNTVEQRVSFEGFVITEGLGMIISAWCAMTLNIIYLGVRG